MTVGLSGFRVTSSISKINVYQFFKSFSFIRYNSLCETDVLQRISSTGLFVSVMYVMFMRYET